MRISKRKFLRSLLSITLLSLTIYSYYKFRQIEIRNILLYIALFLLLTFCLVNGIKEKYLINPFLLFSIVPISLLLYDLSVSTHYLVDLKDNTYYLAIYNIIMILLGFAVGNNMHFHYSNVWKKSINQSETYLAKHAKIAMFIGLIPTFYGCIIGINYLLSFNLNALKRVINSAPLASVLQLFLYLGILCAFYSKKRKVITGCLLMLIFSVIVNFSKTTVVMMCACIVVFLYDVVRNNHKAKKYFYIFIIISILLVFASFTIYNNIRFDYDINGYFNELGYIGNVSQTWFLPLMYLISPWSNLQYIVETTTNYSYGLWVLKPILGYFQIDGFWSEAYTMLPRYQAFNTFTYISVYFRDFGFIGSGVCSFILAIYIMYIYRLKIKYLDSPHISAIFALNMYATIMMFFNNHFQQLSYPFTILIITWIYLKLTHAEYKKQGKF